MEAKLGEDNLRAIEGTTLSSAKELRELLVLNRGAALGELTPVVTRLIEDARAGKPVSAIAVGAGICSTTTSFAAAWGAATPDEIKAKIDTIGWNGLCAVLPEKMRPDLLAHEVFVRRQNDQHGINSEIAELARACDALLEHPGQHVDLLRKKLARIRELSGDNKGTPAQKSKHGIGTARDANGRTFTTITMTANGGDIHVDDNPRSRPH
jgi:hypothetical protein